MNLECRKANFSGHMDPQKIKDLVINNMFEKVEYTFDHLGDNITLIWKKEHNKLFTDLTNVWRRNVGLFCDNSGLQSSFFDIFVTNVFDPTDFYKKKAQIQK